jgi:TonB family protein
MRFVLLAMIFAALLFAQPPVEQRLEVPVVVKFVAPAYPREARDSRVAGKTLMRISINQDGTVSDVKPMIAHRIFKNYVVEALKEWRFNPSNQERIVEITCSFEFLDAKCEHNGTSAETFVSAELPYAVQIKTSLPCSEPDYSRSHGDE